jgi:uncharacterized protein YndB with AHSA1/START domain
VISAEHVDFLQAPPAEVFALISDGARQTEWHPRVKRVEQLSGSDPQLGVRYRGDYKGFGSVEFEIAEFQPPQSVTFVSETKGGTMRHTFEVHEGGAGSTLRQTMSLEPRGMMKLVLPVMRSALKKQLAGNAKAINEKLRAR